MTGSAHHRVRLQGAFGVQLPRAQAIDLFTPSGERRWARGWDPSFPAPAADETELGTVFVTDSHGPVTWVVVGHERDRSIRYAVLAPGIRAGTVEVVCTDEGTAATIATVTYDMTALSETGELWLAEFATRYDAYLDDWGHAIAVVLGA